MSKARALAAILLPLVLLVLPVPAAADARAELSEAWTKFLALKSFRATITNLDDAKQMTAMEFQAPDRYRMTMAGGPKTVVIGSQAYMDMGGQVMKLPVPVDKMTAQYRDEGFLQELQAGMVIEDLGTDSLDGEPMRKIRFVREAEDSDSTAWISTKTGWVNQIDATSGKGRKATRARIRYSDFNDPAIVIEAPR